mmetsp:Transcript_11082/g.24703  ORF Transcript_11082/g.24703 Transcript_11082/m.24703 type:complete len:271 (-) Transcript_11082:44-856(-)
MVLLLLLQQQSILHGQGHLFLQFGSGQHDLIVGNGGTHAAFGIVTKPRGSGERTAVIGYIPSLWLSLVWFGVVVVVMIIGILIRVANDIVRTGPSQRLTQKMVNSSEWMVAVIGVVVVSVAAVLRRRMTAHIVRFVRIVAVIVVVVTGYGGRCCSETGSSSTVVEVMVISGFVVKGHLFDFRGLVNVTSAHAGRSHGVSNGCCARIAIVSSSSSSGGGGSSGSSGIPLSPSLVVLFWMMMKVPFIVFRIIIRVRIATVAKEAMHGGLHCI